MRLAPERRVFIGREAELEQLRAGLAAARHGTGQTIILGGEAGIGKSSLLERFAAEARASGIPVLDGTCLPGTAGGLAYAAFVEILRELIRTTPPARLTEILGSAARDLARLVPELASGELVSDGAPPPRQAQALLFERLLGVLERLTEGGPAVLAIENAHWADQGTRDLLRYLVHGLRDDPVLTIVTARTDGVTEGDDRGFLAELQRAGAERIDLGSLGDADVAELVGALTGRRADPATIERLVERTDGNPFFVEELVRAGSRDGEELPSVLRDVLGARIDQLSPRAREVVRVAAAAGRRVDDELVGATLGIPAREVAASLREAVAAGVLERADDGRGDGYAFRHSLLREAVDAELFPGERTELHRTFAEALEARAAERPGSVQPGELARHWDLAGRADRALGPTIEAARAAEAVFAFGDAVPRWGRARALLAGAVRAGATPALDEPAILERAAECAQLAGEYDRSVGLAREAASLVDRVADPDRAIHLLDRLRWFLWEAGDREAAAVAVREALELIPADPPSAARSRALGQQAGIELFAGEYERSVANARAALEVARAIGSPADEAFALGILGWSEAVLGDVDGGLRRFEEGRRLAEALGSVEGMALAASNLVSLLDRIGRPAEVLAAAREGWLTARRLGVSRSYGALLLGFAAKAEFALGRWDEADRTCLEGLRLRPTGRAEVQLLVGRGRLLTARGQFEAAAEVLARAREADADEGGTDFHAPLIVAEAELGLWSGRPDLVLAAVGEGLEHAAVARPPDPAVAWLAAMGMRVEADAAVLARARHDEPGLARAIERADRIDAALRTALAGLATLPPSEGPRGAALMALYEVEHTRAAGVIDATPWRDLAASWATASRPFPEAYCRFRAAEATLAAHGPRDAAAADLLAALAAARGLGAAPLEALVRELARHARIELDGSGAPTPTDGAAGGPLEPYHLTAREAEVLRFVAAGWTNQQIADELFITRKTASVHVSNILGKLGVERRVEAAIVANRLGLGGAVVPPPTAR